MSPTKAVIFDLDDTLYSERAYAFSGFRAVAESFVEVFGDPERAARTMCQLFDTEHRPRVFDEMCRRAGLSGDDRLVARMIETYRNHKPAIELCADADAALARLRGRRKLGVLSDGLLATQSAKIDALGLRNRVDEIILTDDLGREFWKPHPRAFELMAEKLSARAEDCTYLADNPAKDFVAPRALGWRTIQIRRPEGIYRDCPAAEDGAPDHVITSLDDLVV
jgi:putative hydrolase of the HAD superfamily